MGHMGKIKDGIMFGRVRQVAAPVGGRVVRTGGEMRYSRLPCLSYCNFDRPEPISIIWQIVLRTYAVKRCFTFIHRFPCLSFFGFFVTQTGRTDFDNLDVTFSFH